MSEWAAHGAVNWLPENHMAIFDFRSLFRQLNWQPLNSSEQVVNAQNSQLRMDVMKSLAYSFTTCEKCGHGPFNCPHSKRDRNNTFAFNSNRLQWNHSTRFIAVAALPTLNRFWSVLSGRLTKCSGRCEFYWIFPCCDHQLGAHLKSIQIAFSIKWNH